MKLRLALPAFLHADDGSTTVEFVLVVPIMVMVTIGIINASALLFTVSTMHFATQDAARWCMINSSTCTTTTVNTYATSRYAGAAMSPSFVVTTPATCTGEQVTGSGTFTLVTGMATVSVPITSTACRPFS